METELSQLTAVEIANEYLTTKEAVAMTKYNKATLYQYKSEGKISAIKMRQKLYWSKTELLKFMGIIK
jgi:hypothetical protein